MGDAERQLNRKHLGDTGPARFVKSKDHDTVMGIRDRFASPLEIPENTVLKF